MPDDLVLEIPKAIPSDVSQLKRDVRELRSDVGEPDVAEPALFHWIRALAEMSGGLIELNF